MNEQINEHLQKFNYDVRKSGNARFIDQKVTPDVLYIVANCVLEYVKDNPKIESYVENLILLTATQHSTKAHPNNNTRRIDKAYQYVCLQSKCNTIEQSVDVLKDGFYTKEDFSFVLNTGTNTNKYSNELTFEDIRNNLTEYYHN